MKQLLLAIVLILPSLTYGQTGRNSKDTNGYVKLSPGITNLQEVTVHAVKDNENLRAASMGVEKLSIKDIESIPVLFGERDIMKVMQMTPGVKSAGEGNSGFYVRGGGADQNLILIDDVPIYNASHLMGFFSVFNSDVLKNATLYKGAMPGQFGGRVSSVLDVKTRDGIMDKYSVSGGLGTISSRLTVEGAIKANRGSIIVSGRRTYADLFLKLSNKDNLKNSKLHFYDINVKANYQVAKNDRLSISGYFGRDVLGINKTFGTDWGNTAANLRWNHIFNKRLFSNTSLIYSGYNYRIEFGKGQEQVKVFAGLRDISLKQDYVFEINPNHKIRTGFNAIHHSFAPGKIISNGDSYSNQTLDSKKALEGAIFISDEANLTKRISIDAGLRYSGFQAYAKGKTYSYSNYDDAKLITDNKNWGAIQYYGGVEPRFSSNFELTENSSIKAAYSRTIQYLHLISSSTISSPTDQWITSSNNVKPQIADQTSIGYFRNINQGMFEMSIETYYKALQHQIDYRPGAELVFNSAVERELIYGNGFAYGAELSVKKKTGKLTGWFSYTLSRSFRKFDAVDNGAIYPARQDRIHDLAIVANYDLTPKFKLSANWVYYTGNAATFPSGRYEISGVQVPYYTSRNGYRMPDYHRLDIGVTWYRKKTLKVESSWNFSIYNAYGRENAYTIGFRQNEQNPLQTQAVQTTLFRWVPSISYNFKF